MQLLAVMWLWSRSLSSMEQRLTGKIYDGVVTHWHDNGKKSFESIFRDGKYVKSTEWDESGEESGEVAETSESVGISNFTDKKVEFVDGDVWEARYLIDGVFGNPINK